MKKLLRALVVATCSVVAVGVVSCASSAPPAAPAAGAATDVTYKCACGKTAKVGATVAAPS